MNNCKVCGTIISSSRIYCSDKCIDKNRYNNTIYIKKCKICGEEFPATKGMSVCSTKCSLKAQRNYSKICTICGKEFDSRGNGAYCSDVCYRTANSKTKGLTVVKCEVCNKNFKTLLTKVESTCSDYCSSRLIKTYIDRSHQELFGTTNIRRIREIIGSRREANEKDN